MAEALVRRGRAAEEGGWEIEMTALRRLGREEVHMMNPSGAARPGYHLPEVPAQRPDTRPEADVRAACRLGFARVGPTTPPQLRANHSRASDGRCSSQPGKTTATSTTGP